MLLAVEADIGFLTQEKQELDAAIITDETQIYRAQRQLQVTGSIGCSSVPLLHFVLSGFLTGFFIGHNLAKAENYAALGQLERTNQGRIHVLLTPQWYSHCSSARRSTDERNPLS